MPTIDKHCKSEPKVQTQLLDRNQTRYAMSVFRDSLGVDDLVRRLRRTVGANVTPPEDEDIAIRTKRPNCGTLMPNHGIEPDGKSAWLLDVYGTFTRLMKSKCRDEIAKIMHCRKEKDSCDDGCLHCRKEKDNCNDGCLISIPRRDKFPG